MPTMVTSGRDTANINTDRIDYSFDKGIMLLEPKKYPIQVIMRKLAKKKVNSPKFEWTEDELNPKTDTTSAAATAAATSISVSNYTRFLSGDIVRVPSTGEVMKCTADGAASAISVSRGLGSSVASDIASGAELLIIGNANQENATMRTRLTTQATKLYNYTQIFRNPVEMSRTKMQTAMKDTGSGEWKYQQKKKGIEHARQIENSILFGFKSEVTSGTHPIRTCDGIVARISTNIKVVADPGTLTEADFEDFLNDVFTYGSDTRWMFGGKTCISVINRFATGKIQINQEDRKKYGLAIRTYVTPLGDVKLVHHPELDGDTHSKWGILLDMSDGRCRWRYLQDTILKTNIQANDRDGRTDEYLTEGAPQIKEEKCHGIIKNVSR